MKRQPAALLPNILSRFLSVFSRISLEMPKTVSAAEVAKHCTREDCWVILNGRVYDLTSFLGDHPAGAGVILKHAGKDATAAFDPFHPSDIIARMGLEDKLFVGLLDSSAPAPAATSSSAATVSASLPALPPLQTMLNIHDFEAVARVKMAPAAWAYYSSGADDEITLRENRLAFHRIWLRPRVMVDVSRIDTSSTLLGIPTSFPVSVCSCVPAAAHHPVPVC